MEPKIEFIRFTLKKRDRDSELSTKVLQTLSSLKSINEDLFGKWYEQSNSKSDAKNKQVIFEYSFIDQLIKKNWDKKFNNLGSGFMLWTGKDDDSFVLSFKIGLTNENISLHNVISLQYPIDNYYYKAIDNELIQGIKKVVMNIWDIEEVIVFEK